MRAGTAFVVMGIAAVVLAGSPPARAGSLEPPGPPAPTMKTLDQVEPRKPVQSLPGNGEYLHVISQPGSYYLTGDIVAPTGMNGILINAIGSVTLDLNGFALVGLRDTLAKDGIAVQAFFTRPLTIKNGVLRDWDGFAIKGFPTNDSTYEDLQIYNSFHGIQAGQRSVVRHCLVNGCNAGISGGAGATIVDSVAEQNVIGIQLDFGGRIEKCTVYSSADYGILVGSDTLVRGNTLSVTSSITVIGTHNTIDGNSCNNTSNCISMTAPTATGNLVIRNTSVGNAVDYFIGPGNTVGPITSDPATAGPWANLAVD